LSLNSEGSREERRDEKQKTTFVKNCPEPKTGAVDHKSKPKTKTVDKEVKKTRQEVAIITKRTPEMRFRGAQRRR